MMGVLVRDGIFYPVRGGSPGQSAESQSDTVYGRGRDSLLGWAAGTQPATSSQAQMKKKSITYRMTDPK